MRKLFSGLTPALYLTPLVLMGLAASFVQPATSQIGGGRWVLPFEGSVSSGKPAFSITNTGSGEAIRGVSSSYGLYGTSSSGVGVLGTSGNIGVWGSSGSGKGVYGDTDSGFGVEGRAYASGTGIYGYSGSYVGVWGQSPVGYGVYGNGNVGVLGTSSNIGVWGGSGSGLGVYGSTDSGYGVFGQALEGGIGVFGVNDNNIGVVGRGVNGVYGFSNSSDSIGVVGILQAGNNGAGVGGVEDYGLGLYGAAGFLGIHDAQTDWSIGVFGYQGINANWAGWFNGNIGTNGTLEAAVKHFKIDHPLDPANKYLVHSCVESNERMNIYNGNVTTDANGDAEVLLPHYFEALNRDFRYQLTVIGQFAQAVVATKIQNNRFTIKTDKPFVEVSWQVTGIRQDAYARAHPMQAEIYKPDNERGKYLHPVEHGQPESMGMDYELRRGMEARILPGRANLQTPPALPRRKR